MSINEALNSHIFLCYLAIAIGALAISGVLLAALKYVFKKNIAHAWASYRGWLVMIPLVFAAIFLGRISTIVFFSLVSLFGFKEYARATGLYINWPITSVVYAGIIAVAVAAGMADPFKGCPGWYGFFAAMPVFAIAAILLMPIIQNRCEGQLQLLALAIVGFIYLGWMFGHVVFLANTANAYGYLLYLLVAVELNDVAAFTFGKAFGRHPLRSNISPKKTWEGSLGAVGVSLALPWIMRFSFPHFGPAELILTGLIVGVGGQLGDLSISVIKRDLHIKDMGSVIRGHGGILDRTDSLIYVAPLFFHMILYSHGLY